MRGYLVFLIIKSRITYCIDYKYILRVKKLTIILLSFFYMSFSSLHKYYIALTEIEYSSKSKSIQIIMNVFMDDIELAINKEYNTKLNLDTKTEIKNTDALFIDYLNKHFKIEINNESKRYNFIGKEYDGDILYFYLEIENIFAVNSIQIKNNVLVKHFSNQQNLVKATINKNRKSLFLNKESDKGLLKF